MASVKQQWKLGLLHILLLALLVSQASLLFRRASARALEADRGATAEVTNQVMKKETKDLTTKDATTGSNYYGGGGGYGGGWSHGGGGWSHGGGGWGHGGGGWGYGRGDWEDHDGKKS